MNIAIHGYGAEFLLAGPQMEKGLHPKMQPLPSFSSRAVRRSRD